MRVRMLACAAAVITVLLGFSLALGQVEGNRKAEGIHLLEESVRRSAAACYAAEGMYPPDLVYLQEHYGLQIDSRRYVVSYTSFAENLMPDITVLEK